MTNQPIVTPSFEPRGDDDHAKPAKKRPDLHTLWQQPDALPEWVTASPTVQRYLDLLGLLDWGHLPERNLQRNWGQATVPYAALAATQLLKLNEGLSSLGAVHQFLREHPGLRWLFGFPGVLTSDMRPDLNTPTALPTARHLTQMLRTMPNSVLQWLLADSVRCILAELRVQGKTPVECVAVDTKHILAWVKENNPKAYVPDRFNPAKHPTGDPDCQLGCKRRPRQATTLTRLPFAAARTKVGEYYWGYGSGIVVTKVPGGGEFVLAELTQPFDQADVTYFFPLMRQVEERLGYRPRFGAFDAAFDAWYVYAYFYRENDPAGGFAAVSFSKKGGYTVTRRQFSPEGLPICTAGLPMPLKFTFTDRTTCLVEHERGKYVCPLLFPEPNGQACPIHHDRWKHGGCTAMMPTSIGARLRYTLDRDSDEYQRIYRQRTAAERLNSQAVALGIERPHLRNGHAIANQNTLIYLLINLRFLQRLRQASNRRPNAA